MSAPTVRTCVMHALSDREGLVEASGEEPAIDIAELRDWLPDEWIVRNGTVASAEVLSAVRRDLWSRRGRPFRRDALQNLKDWCEALGDGDWRIWVEFVGAA